MTSKRKKSLHFIDLFCGIGGFHQAMKRINGKCVFACDIDKNCREVYSKNYNITPESDITKIDIASIPDFDILCAGFPCQAFSNAGNKKTFKDKRGLLFDEIIKILDVKHPKFVFLENVKHIKKVGNGKVFKHILEQLTKSKYHIDEHQIFELSPHQLGIPQQRERVLFVAIRDDVYDEHIEITLDLPDVNISFENILEKNVDKKYCIEPDILQVLEAWDEMIDTFNIGEKLSPTIMCHEFYKKYTDEEFLDLPVWKQDYIKKNKPIYLKYKKQWDKWYKKHKDILQNVKYTENLNGKRELKRKMIAFLITSFN